MAIKTADLFENSYIFNSEVTSLKHLYQRKKKKPFHGFQRQDKV